jgi:hypothetical protein
MCPCGRLAYRQFLDFNQLTGGDEMNNSSADEVMETLTFLVAADNDAENSMGLFSSREGGVALKEIPVAALRENLGRAVTALRGILNDAAPDEAGTLRLREAHVGLEISGSGGISMVGTCQVGAKAAITLVFGE